MIDVKKNRNNFQKFPSLKQICDPVIVAKRQTAIKIATTTTTITTPKNSKSQTATEPLKITKTADASKNSINIRKTTTATNNLNEGSPSKSNNTNPVREANQHFFLVPEFQDQNFLKAECELAHAQVYKQSPKSTSIERNSNLKTLLPAINNIRISNVNIKKLNPSSNNNSPQTSAAKAATINGMRRSGNGTHLGTTTAVAASINKVDISSYSQYKGLSSASVTQSSLSSATPSSSLSTSSANKKATSVYATTNNSSTSTFSSYGITKLSRNTVKPLIHRTGAGAITTTRAASVTNSSSPPSQQNNIINNNNNNGSNSSLNSLTNSGNNNMQTSLEQDDIKFIDSDDQPAATAGPSLAERKCEQPRCYLNHAHSSAITKARVRPKSTIICSTSSSSAAVTATSSTSTSNSSLFEKVNNYKYGSGSLPMSAAANERRTETAIDSNSIRASIEKFNSFSEQKRLPLSSVTLRSHSGSGSTSNLQHHRHSSDLDNSNVRLQSGGGSLTRTSYRSSGGATAAAAAVGKVITSIYPNASAAVSSSTSRHHQHHHRHHHALSGSPCSGTGSLPLKSTKHYVQAEDTSLSRLSSSVDGDVSKKKLNAISGGLCDNTDENSVSSPSAIKANIHTYIPPHLNVLHIHSQV